MTRWLRRADVKITQYPNHPTLHRKMRFVGAVIDNSCEDVLVAVSGPCDGARIVGWAFLR